MLNTPPSRRTQYTFNWMQQILSKGIATCGCSSYNIACVFCKPKETCLWENPQSSPAQKKTIFFLPRKIYRQHNKNICCKWQKRERCTSARVLRHSPSRNELISFVLDFWKSLFFVYTSCRSSVCPRVPFPSNKRHSFRWRLELCKEFSLLFLKSPSYLKGIILVFRELKERGKENQKNVVALEDGEYRDEKVLLCSQAVFKFMVSSPYFAIQGVLMSCLVSWSL